MLINLQVQSYLLSSKIHFSVIGLAFSSWLQEGCCHSRDHRWYSCLRKISTSLSSFLVRFSKKFSSTSIIGQSCLTYAGLNQWLVKAIAGQTANTLTWIKAVVPSYIKGQCVIHCHILWVRKSASFTCNCPWWRNQNPNSTKSHAIQVFFEYSVWPTEKCKWSLCLTFWSTRVVWLSPDKIRV